MHTSEDIRSTTFNQSRRGYEQRDVDAFIEQVANDMRTLEAEKKDLEDKLYVLAEKIEQYKAEEDSIKVTLINSRKLGESIVNDAKEKAETILREATIKKNDIISSAYAEIEGSENTLARLKKEVSDFKNTILHLYKEHIESLTQLPDSEKPRAVAAEPAEEKKAEPEAVVQPETVVSEPTQVFDPVEKNIVNEAVAEARVESPTEIIPSIEEKPAPEEKFKNISSLFEG